MNIINNSNHCKTSSDSLSPTSVSIVFSKGCPRYCTANNKTINNKIINACNSGSMPLQKTLIAMTTTFRMTTMISHQYLSLR